MNFFYYVMLLINIATPIVKMVLRALGVGVVSYIGINVILTQAKEAIISNIGSAPGPMQMILGIAKFDIAINIYMAAVTTRLVLAGMDKVSGKLSKMRSSTTGTLEA